MARVGLPVDVVVVHRADHVIVQERGIDWIRLETSDETGAGAAALLAPDHLAMVREEDVGILLLRTAEAAAHRVEPEQLRFLDRRGGEVLVLESAGPFGKRVGEVLLVGIDGCLGHSCSLPVARLCSPIGGNQISVSRYVSTTGASASRARQR